MDTAAFGAEFWVGLFKIIWIDVILSGDNAVVIALAARSLPAHQQRRAIIMGSGFAIVMRVLLTLVAAKLMQLPYLQVIGGLLLLWIGSGLLKGDDPEEAASGSTGNGSMMTAIRTIVLADMVMCLDNVLAVAATAQGHMLLLLLGLAISIPLVVFGSTIMIRIMERWPVVVILGAALIGWVAGETIVKDQALLPYTAQVPWLHYAAAVAGAALVLLIGFRQKNKAAVASNP